MHQRPPFVPIGVTVGFLLAGFILVSSVHAQAQTIRASNAWARRASAMGSMEKMGKMDKMEKMDKMPSDKSSMSQMGGGGTGAVYVTLSNAGSHADSLISASSEAAQTIELHEAKNEGGVMTMRPVKSIQVPAGGKVELKPGGYHIMLLNLKHDLKPGEKIPLTLTFERGGELRIEAAVR